MIRVLQQGWGALRALSPAVAIIGALAGAACTNGFAATSEPCPRTRDLNGDGMVGAADLALVLSAFGESSPDADLNGDGVVSAPDIAAVLGAWGAATPRGVFFHGWTFASESDIDRHGAWVSTDDVPDRERPDCTMPTVVDVPGGGKALRCRVFEWNRHSELHLPVPSPDACEIYLAFDVYIDSSSLPYGGDPYVNWVHWLRVGEGPADELAMLYGHLSGPEGLRLRMHLATTGPLHDHENVVPFDQWVRLMIRWSAARDGRPGEMVFYRHGVEYARHEHWKGEPHRMRLRMRSVAPCNSGVIYFRNVAMGTSRAQVWTGPVEHAASP